MAADPIICITMLVIPLIDTIVVNTSPIQIAWLVSIPPISVASIYKLRACVNPLPSTHCLQIIQSNPELFLFALPFLSNDVVHDCLILLL